MQLLNDGILIKIWSQDVVKCGKCFQWIRNAILGAADDGFFDEYILVESESRKTLLPYNTLEILNSWNLTFYCLPEIDNSKTLVPIDIKNISQKCGLKCRSFEEETTDITMRYRKMCEQGGSILINYFEKVTGDVINNETLGRCVSYYYF